MPDRFEVTKMNGRADGVPASELNNNANGQLANAPGSPSCPISIIEPSGHVLQQNPNRTSRVSKRGLGSLLRGRQDQEDRKWSLAQLTKEALPRLDNYRVSRRNLNRPSIGELHGEPVQDEKIDINDPSADAHTEGIKLGWITGVLIPCLLNIFGVMLFLRLSWVVAQSGIFQSLVHIAISAVVCIITTLSLSAISTNGEVKGGGVYFIISRSLGPEFGASVGVVFAFANAVAASMNTIGFCDSINELLASQGLKIIDGGINDVRIVGVVTILVLILICCVGMEWESKAQNFLIAIIVIAIFNFLIGAGIGPRGDETAIAKGFVGYSWDTVKENFGSDYRFSEGVNQNFFSVFAIFFPSVTGIQAGANICGDLKDPAASIPKGTLWSLFISMSTYAVFVLFAGATAVKDASGDVADLINGTLVSSKLPCKLNNTCAYGLANSYSVMQLMSVWGPLIYAGCWAATLSTALTNLLSVPRLVQALGIDRIYPGLIFFSKPYGKHGEPYRGYVLTFIISSAFLLIGELNVIAPLISTFYLASYALINFCTFHAAFVKPLGWRPTFRFYNMWLSLFGFVLCVGIMFLIDWMSALITFAIIFALYLVVMYRKPDANWGSSTQAQQYKGVLTAVHRLQNVSDHVKNYHPQVLVVCGDPKIRPPLIDLGHMLTKHNSLMFVGNIIPIRVGFKNRQTLIQEGQKYLDARKIKAFYNVIDGFTMEEGVEALIKSTGFGKLAPNIVLIGYKSDWHQVGKNEVESYFHILHNAFSQRMSVVILRLPNGLDFSSLDPEISVTPPNGFGHLQTANAEGCTNFLMPPSNTASELLYVDSNLNLSSLDSPQNSFHDTEATTMPNMSSSRKYTVHQDCPITYKAASQVPQNMLEDVAVFTKKQPKSTIDVFWLYDDGGLTMLLPYIILMRSNWQHCKLRVFALSHGRDEETEEKNMASLLTKFRINYSELVMLKGVSERPHPDTIAKHKYFLQQFGYTRSSHEFGVSEEELQAMEEKTHRQLRIHELIAKHSKAAALIVMSLPMPRQEAISAALYMSWLEMLTSDVTCPIILARGNQTPVLTLYS